MYKVDTDLCAVGLEALYVLCVIITGERNS